MRFYLARSTLSNGLQVFETKPKPVPSYDAVNKKLDVFFPNRKNCCQLAHLYGLCLLFPALAYIKPGEVRAIDIDKNDDDSYKLTIGNSHSE